MAVTPVKPQEEFIELAFDDEDRVKVERPQKTKDDGKGKGKGSGSKKQGKKVAQRALLTVGDDDEEKKKRQEPKMGKQNIHPETWNKYSRDDGADKSAFKGVTEKKLNAQLKKTRRRDNQSVLQLVKSEVLQTAEAGFLEPEGRERTFKFRQSQIAKEVTLGAAQKRFSFDLPSGPYRCAFTSNGQHLIAAGRKGQVAMLHCDTMNIMAELQLRETVRDVKALHNHTMFAVAQKKYTYVYDQAGIELHCIKDMKYQTHLEFLPYHYLLVSAGEMADMHYRDISTGQQVGKFRTHLGPCRAIRMDPRNAVVQLGHSNGTVTMWTPTVKEPVVKMFAHQGHVTGIAVHGNYMATTGADGTWKIWDLRTYESLQGQRCYGHAPSDIDLSMNGLMAVGYGCHLEIWKDVLTSGDRPGKPYLQEDYNGKIVNSTRFRPYEDVCGVGLSSGFAGVLVPGAGYANFDSFEANPFETKKQRREKEVRTLIEKLQPDTIMLDPNKIGNVDSKIVKKYQAEVEQERKEAEALESKKLKKKMRGANKSGRREKRKQLQLAKAQREKTKDRLDDEEDGSDDEDGDITGDEAAEGSDASSEADKGPDAAKKREAGAALGRFYGKRRRKT